jgi:acetoin utilization protein AcuC
VCSGGPFDPRSVLPAGWRATSTHVTGKPAPTLLGDRDEAPRPDPWDAGDGDPDSPLDRAIAATRHAVLPLHGLDPSTDR